jgi:hypothetical protein
VAWMVAALYDNADSPSVAQSVSLGRFSVQAPSTGSRDVLLIPDSLGFADAALRSSGLILRSVRVGRDSYDDEDTYST